MISRRSFMRAVAMAAATPRVAVAGSSVARFGPLLRDPREILDLPAGFEYRVVSRAGDEMDDGLLVPTRADGMAAFAGGDGTVTLVCNHENHPSGGGPFGVNNERLEQLDPEKIYDRGAGRTPGCGGTTTIVYDPGTRQTLRRHLSLAGTEINCAGGPTPWASWLSCEECFKEPGVTLEFAAIIEREHRHGYIFEVPANAATASTPEPLRAMGRFEHEAAAVDPASGIVFLSEDKLRSLLYRFVPNVAGQLQRGGRLQALAVADRPSFDTRNWDRPNGMRLNVWLPTRWIDLQDTDPHENDLRLRGFEAGAARFARGEGLCYAGGSIFLSATIGGPERLGQVFEYRVSATVGKQADPKTDGRLRLIAQASHGDLLQNADNLTMSPWGDLIICEDTAHHCGLLGMTPSGIQYVIGDNPYYPSELAGVCFSPDGKTLFVNLQNRGLTLAITGPWGK